MNEKRVFRVGISGSYGGLKLGDEAILESMIAQLRDSAPVEITVFSRKPEDTLQRHRVESALPVRRLSREEARKEIERLDLFVLGGGGILYDDEAEIYLREVLLAQEAGVPVMIYAVSAGPLKNPAARGMVRDALNQAAVMTVRGRQGLHLLEEVGVTKQIHLTADPALLLQPQALPPNTLEREGLEGKPRLIAFSVREPGPAAPDIDPDHYRSLLANAADFIVERLDADMLFIPMEREHMDVQYSHAVVAQMQFANRVTVLKGEYTPGQIMTLIGQCEFAVGMRLHFLIFAAHEGVPFVALPYASKVTGLIEDLEMKMPPLKSVNIGRLIAGIDYSWDLRSEIRARIQRLLPGLQQRARETNERLLRLLMEKK